MIKKYLFYIFFALNALFIPMDIWAFHNTASAKKQSILLKAQDVSNDNALGIIIARGNVRISNGLQTVEADTVTYNKKLNQLTASGHVKLFDADGDVISTNYAELSDDLREGFLKEAYMYTMAKERLAAANVRKDGEKTYFNHGVYTPCKMCAGQKYPTWQLQAREILRDEQAGDVIYKDAVFSFKGVPTIRTPYFRHPDPSVKRRSGFLAPFFGTDTLYGGAVGVPYYWNIKQDQEATITPVLMTKQLPVLMVDYQQRFRDAIFHFSGSGTKSSHVTGASSQAKLHRKKMHGHFVTDGRYDVNDKWRLSYDVKRTSNPTYLKRYQFVEQGKYTFHNSLMSNVAAEGFYDKSYLGIQGYDFQNLRADVRKETVPTVAPMTTYQYVSNPGALGQYWTVDASQLSLKRTQGTNMDRLSSSVRWSLPYIFHNGQVIDLDASLRGDVYNVREFAPLNSSRKVNNTVGRALPLTSLNWRMPFINRSSSVNWIIEPRAGLILSPVRRADLKIPNEDSLDFEYDINKLFLSNRLPGLDVMDTGQRANYGVNLEGYTANNQRVKTFLGQSYSFSKTNGFTNRSGIQKGKSDYLGRFQLSPHPWLDVYSDFRWHYRTLRVRRNVTGAKIGSKAFNLNVSYLQVNDVFERNAYTNRRQIAGIVSAEVTDEWSTFAGASRQLKPTSSRLAQSAGVIYQDDCFAFKTEFIQTFYQDRDLKPATTVMFTFTLKNLGVYSTGPLKTSGFAGTREQEHQRDKEEAFLRRP